MAKSKLEYFIRRLVIFLKYLRNHPEDVYNQGVCRSTLHKALDEIGQEYPHDYKLTRRLSSAWHGAEATWEHFSGSYGYPIADPSGYFKSPIEYYYAMWVDKWEPGSEQLKLRLSFIDHMITELERGINNE